MTVPNTAFAKPNYQVHRKLSSDAGAIVADSAVLSSLLTITVVGGTLPRRDPFDAGGWRTVRGIVRLTGGVNPTADLVPLEMATLKAAGGDTSQQLVPLAAATGALSDGATFLVTINGGRLFMRLNAVTGAPTLIEVFLAGAEAMNVMPGAHREG